MLRSLELSPSSKYWLLVFVALRINRTSPKDLSTVLAVYVEDQLSQDDLILKLYRGSIGNRLLATVAKSYAAGAERYP